MESHPTLPAQQGAKKMGAQAVMSKPSRMQVMYRETIAPALMKKYNYKNFLEVPRLLKIVVNMGVGEGVNNPKDVDEAAKEMAMITGQMPIVIKSTKAISNFHLKENTPIGCKVTLRGKRMYEFFDRLVSVALPRVRDFRGVPANSFDGRGNYNMGITDQVIFPEVDLDKVKRTQGMDIAFITSAKTDEEAKNLLETLGMPFRSKEKES